MPSRLSLVSIHLILVDGAATRRKKPAHLMLMRVMMKAQAQSILILSCLTSLALSLCQLMRKHAWTRMLGQKKRPDLRRKQARTHILCQKKISDLRRLHVHPRRAQHRTIRRRRRRARTRRIRIRSIGETDVNYYQVATPLSSLFIRLLYAMLFLEWQTWCLVYIYLV